MIVGSRKVGALRWIALAALISWAGSTAVACASAERPPLLAPPPPPRVSAPTLPTPWPPPEAPLAEQLEGGDVLLPAELAIEVGERLALCDELPALADAAIEEQARRDAVHLEAAVAVCGAECDRYVAVIESQSGWQWWEVGLLAGGAAAAGLFVGVVVGIVAASGGGPVVVTP